jgi:hypothetical protein
LVCDVIVCFVFYEQAEKYNIENKNNL